MSEPTQEPEFPRPSVGDEFVIRREASRYREEEIQPIRYSSGPGRFRSGLPGI